MQPDFYQGAKIQNIIDKSKFHFEFIDLGGGMGIDYDHNNKKLNLKKYNSYIQKSPRV